MQLDIKRNGGEPTSTTGHRKNKLSGVNGLPCTVAQLAGSQVRTWLADNKIFLTLH